MGKLFYNTCVNWNMDDIDLLHELTDHAEEISYNKLKTLVSKEDLASIEFGLGYGAGLKMKDDYAVSFHIHPLTQIPYFQHSRIEYVFATNDDVGKLRDVWEKRKALDEIASDIASRHKSVVNIPADLQRTAFVNEWADDLVEQVMARAEDTAQDANELGSKIATCTQLIALRGGDNQDLKAELDDLLGLDADVFPSHACNVSGLYAAQNDISCDPHRKGVILGATLTELVCSDDSLEVFMRPRTFEFKNATIGQRLPESRRVPRMKVGASLG